MKSPNRKVQETHLARPATESGWEIWTLPPAAPRLVRTCENFENSESKTLRVAGLPAHGVLAFARWMQTGDETLLPEMVPTFLDRHGLAPRQSGGQGLSWATLIREENRTLVLVRLLAGAVPDAWCLGQVQRYEASVDLIDLPERALFLWREGGRLTVAFTRAAQAVHLQSFAGGTVTPEVATELLCTRYSLETEEVIDGLDSIELAGEFTVEERQALSSVLGLEPVDREIGAPILPKEVSKLLPAQVAVLRQKALRRKTIERVLLGAAAVYVLILLGLIVNVLWLTFQKHHLRSTITQNRPTVEAIRATSERWRALEPAVNPVIYPLEVLFQSAQLLPADGARFTLFEHRDHRVTIRGEANDAAAAFKLVEDIKARAELNWFDWEMPRPNILPNDKAEFQIQGTSPDAQAN